MLKEAKDKTLKQSQGHRSICEPRFTGCKCLFAGSVTAGVSRCHTKLLCWQHDLCVPTKLRQKVKPASQMHYSKAADCLLNVLSIKQLVKQGTHYNQHSATPCGFAFDKSRAVQVNEEALTICPHVAIKECAEQYSSTMEQ